MTPDDDKTDFFQQTLFYKTPPAPCGYLPNRNETKILTWLSGDNAEKTHSLLLELGFRRSQTISYKPICTACSACIPIRIPVRFFKPNKQQKRTLKVNHDIFRIIASPVLYDKHYDLYMRYMRSRHHDQEMSKMSFRDVAMMTEETTIDTAIIEYYHQTPTHDILIGWVLTDFSDNGLSMVYSVFDPDYAHNSLGTYAVLNHIALAQETSLEYLYLGYWIAESKKMSYKNKFKPHQIFVNNHWQDV